MPFILRRSGEDPKWSTWKKAPKFFGDYSPENEHDWRLENPPCSLWSTSSNGGCFQCHVSFLGRIFLVIFFEETEDDTMFCCCKTNVFFDFSVGWWALQCAQRSCQILGVSWGFGIQTTKKQLAFQKREKKRPPGKENPWFFFVSISPTHLHKNAAKHFSRWCFFYVTSIDSVDPPLGEAGHSERFPTWDGVLWNPLM